MIKDLEKLIKENKLKVIEVHGRHVVVGFASKDTFDEAMRLAEATRLSIAVIQYKRKKYSLAWNIADFLGIDSILDNDGLINFKWLSLKSDEVKGDEFSFSFMGSDFYLSIDIEKNFYL